MYNKLTPQEPTFERFMQTIISRGGCGRHRVPSGVPCFHIPSGVEGSGYLSGVCNWRAKRAGFNNSISEKSLRLNRRNPKR